MLVPHEDVLSVALGPLRILKLHGVGKEEVLLVSADMWVNDGDQTTTSLSDLSFHSLHGILGEVDTFHFFQEMVNHCVGLPWRTDSHLRELELVDGVGGDRG